MKALRNYGIRILIWSILFGMGMLMTGSIVRASEQQNSNETRLLEPCNIKGKYKASKVKLTWAAVENAESYTIYKSTKQTKGYKKLATVKKLSYSDGKVKKGVSYYYKIRANHKVGTYSSGKSEVLAVHLAPSTPQGIGYYTKKKVKVSWDKVEGATAYEIYKKDKNGKYCLMATTEKLYSWDKNVKKGKRYYYKVVALRQIADVEKKSGYSQPISVYTASVDPKKKMVALTYDDGPGPYTKEIVKSLKENDSRATFFVLGSRIDAYKSALKSADKIGCEIGNHTYSHLALAGCSQATIQSEIEKTDKKIKKVIGKQPTLMRPPYGSVNSTVKNSAGKPMILWSVDTLDWKDRNSSRIANEVVGTVKDGDIVLMHDIHKTTKTASLSLIPKLRKKGYQLVTVSELAQYRKYKLKKGQTYYSFRKK